MSYCYLLYSRQCCAVTLLCCVLYRHCWLGVRKSIWPVKNWLRCLPGARCKWFCTWSSRCHCHPITSCLIKIEIRLTVLVPAYPVVLETRPLNRHVLHVDSIHVATSWRLSTATERTRATQVFAERLRRHTELDIGRQQETADDTSEAFKGRTVGIAVQ